MIIDFHTHVFPDHMAARVIDNMAVETGIMPYFHGTRDELINSMAENNVDISVLLPVVTKPSQFKTVNTFAQSIAKTYDNGARLIAFGGVHPDSPTLKEELTELRNQGIKGIKLHPDYQGMDFDDPRFIRAINLAAENDMITVVHSGLDMAYSRHVHCTPDKVVNALDKIDPEKVVLAHMGALYYFDEVEDMLCGKGFYFDTGYFIGKTSPRQITRLMRKNGIDRILFATDYPWNSHKQSVGLMDTFQLTPEELDMVLYKNAARLLDID